MTRTCLPIATLLLLSTALPACGPDGPPSAPGTGHWASSPGLLFVQDAGSEHLVSMEAENFHGILSQAGRSWTSDSTAGYSGTGAMRTTPDWGTNNNTGYTTSSPRLDFAIDFVTTGTHYVWVRGNGANGSGDSVHAGLDGSAVSSADRIGNLSLSGWAWTKQTMDAPVATIYVDSTGLHTLNLWMREDGAAVDKIVLTTSSSYSPNGTGPLESPQSSGGAGSCGTTNDACHGSLQHGDWNYCTAACPCGWGEGNCGIEPGSCQPGLECIENIGEHFGADDWDDICVLPGWTTSQTCSGSGSGCVPDGSCSGICGASGVDNCGGACTSSVCDSGCPGANDCGQCGNAPCGTCGTTNDACHGSLQHGDWNYCTAACPCGWGEGNCGIEPGSCQPGLECIENIGEHFGADDWDDICVLPGWTTSQTCSGSGSGCVPDGSCSGTCGASGVDNCGGACTSSNCDPGCPDEVDDTTCGLCDNDSCEPQVGTDFFCDCSVNDGTGGSGTFADPFQSIDDINAASLSVDANVYFLSGSMCLEDQNTDDETGLRVDWGSSEGITIGCYWNDGGTPNKNCTGRAYPVIDHGLGKGKLDWGELSSEGWNGGRCGGTLYGGNAIIVEEENVTVKQLVIQNICYSAIVLNDDNNNRSLADGFALHDTVIENIGDAAVRERCVSNVENYSADCTDDMEVLRNVIRNTGRTIANGFGVGYGGWTTAVQIGESNGVFRHNIIENHYGEGVDCRYTKESQAPGSGCLIEENIIANTAFDAIHVCHSNSTIRNNLIVGYRSSGVQGPQSPYRTDPSRPEFWHEKRQSPSGHLASNCREGGQSDSCARGIGVGSDGCNSGSNCSPVSDIQVSHNVIVGGRFGIMLHNGKNRTQDNWRINNNLLIDNYHNIRRDEVNGPTTNVEIRNNISTAFDADDGDVWDLRLGEAHSGDTGWSISHNFWAADPPECTGPACSTSPLSQSSFDGGATDRHISAGDDVGLGNESPTQWQSIGSLIDFTTMDLTVIAPSDAIDSGVGLGVNACMATASDFHALPLDAIETASCGPDMGPWTVD